MKQQRIVIMGSNFEGLSAALELERTLGDRHRITVVSGSHEFLFTPALALLAFGQSTRAGLTFSFRALLAKHGIRLREEEVTRLDLERRCVHTRTGEERYDHLIIATGPRSNYAAVPGLGPRGYTQSVCSVAEAQRAGLAFERLLEAPGPVIVGEAPGATSHRAAHDFLVNAVAKLAHHGLDVPLTWLTPGDVPLSPAIAGVESVQSAVIQRVCPDEIILADGRSLPFAYAMIVPPVLGVDAVRACEAITNASGFVLVNEQLQCERHPEVCAAGTAGAADPSTAASFQLAEEMGKRVAQNIAARIEGRPMSSQASEVAPPPGSEPRWSPRSFETYFAG